MFDASNYVLGLYLYCCWSLVLFWTLFVAFWWRFLGWRHRLQCVVIMWSFLRLLKLHKLAVGKLDLWGGFTRCHGVLDHGLNLNQNSPLRENHHLTQANSAFHSFTCCLSSSGNRCECGRKVATRYNFWPSPPLSHRCSSTAAVCFLTRTETIDGSAHTLISVHLDFVYVRFVFVVCVFFN